MYTEKTLAMPTVADEPDQMPASTSVFKAVLAKCGPSDKIRAALDANEEEARRQAYERRKREAFDAAWELKKRVELLVETIGRRYSQCTLESYRTSDPTQEAALADVVRYADNLETRITDGVNILLNGTPGTGKTHLLAALAILAAKGGYRVAWRNGPALWEEFIAAMKADGEQVVIDELTSADVFVLDDPLGVADTLSDYRREKLFRVLDQRNRDMRPTWVSVNIAKRDALEVAMGKATVDRLCGGALRLCFTWDSYRTKGGE